MSVWRNIEIPFDLSGSMNVVSGAVNLTKVHNGTYTNEVHYRGVVDVDMISFIHSIRGTYRNGTFALVKEGGVYYFSI